MTLYALRIKHGACRRSNNQVGMWFNHRDNGGRLPSVHSPIRHLLCAIQGVRPPEGAAPAGLLYSVDEAFAAGSLGES